MSKADVVIADLAFSGGARVDNAVFLVLDDKALTLSNGRRLSGLIGFPVIAGFGDVEFSRSAARFGGGGKVVAAAASLALSESDLLLRASFDRHDILCRLDTGAARTIFYEPFYRAFRASFGGARKRAVRIGGATGAHRLAALEASSISISIAGKKAMLRDVAILTSRVGGSRSQGLFCNLGRDALAQLAPYRIDLKNMTLSSGD
jgi:hypothetical protein